MSDIHIGTVVEIVVGAPTTYDKAGYETLFADGDAVGGMVEAPAFATTHSDIQIPSLGTGFTKTRKGAEVGVSSSMMWSTAASDAGQTALIAASRARAEYSLSVLSADGVSISYCTGIIKDYAPNKPTTTSYVGGAVNFVPNVNEVLTTPPA